MDNNRIIPSFELLKEGEKQQEWTEEQKKKWIEEVLQEIDNDLMRIMLWIERK
jgi:hypothetical protein